MLFLGLFLKEEKNIKQATVSSGITFQFLLTITRKNLLNLGLSQ